MLMVLCSNINRAMKLLILGVGFFAMYSCFSKAKINVIYIFTNKSLNTVHFFPTDLVREEVIVILASQFLMFFNQTALEVCHTPFFFF